MTVNGIRLQVIIEGNGPDVILRHGFPDSSPVWRNQIPALAAAGSLASGIGCTGMRRN